MKAAAGGVVGDLARARMAAEERGQRLGELEERTALMMSSAEMFSKHAHEVRGVVGGARRRGGMEETCFPEEEEEGRSRCEYE